MTCAVTDKSLSMSVDGAIGALLLDMGVRGEEVMAINILATMPGMAAHVIEEIRDGVPLRIVADHDIQYTLAKETRPWVSANDE